MGIVDVVTAEGFLEEGDARRIGPPPAGLIEAFTSASQFVEVSVGGVYFLWTWFGVMVVIGG